MSHSLFCVPLKVISNQTSKQAIWTNNWRSQNARLFHRSCDIASKLLVIIHIDKMSTKKER